MSVPVEQRVSRPGYSGWLGRNVRKKKSHALAFELERNGPAEVRVAVAFYHVQRRSELFEIGERRWIADVAQMPDFVRSAEPLRQRRGIAIMRVGQDGDLHSRINFAQGPFVPRPKTRNARHRGRTLPGAPAIVFADEPNSRQLRMREPLAVRPDTYFSRGFG